MSTDAELCTNNKYSRKKSAADIAINNQLLLACNGCLTEGEVSNAQQIIFPQGYHIYIK